MLYTKECDSLNAFYELQIVNRTSNSNWAFYKQGYKCQFWYKSKGRNIIKNDSKNDVIIHAQGEFYLVLIVCSICMSFVTADN